MGDPFSIATGVAGLVSLGITVCDGLHTYFSAIKDRKDDLAIVTQNLALFKFHIFAVQSSASKLGHRHSPAIDGLQLSLINCEMQLRCLESLLNELRPTEDLSLAREGWRKQRLIARYPFDRKKLVQLEEYLSRANTTLSSFIQALSLDINIRMSDELESFRTSLEALDINTQTTLRTITTRLDVIGPKVEPSTLQLLPSRIEEVTASSLNSIVLHQTALGVAKMKTGAPRNERSSQDLTNAHSKPRYLQNAELERRLSSLTQEYPAGPYSISFELQPRNIVESSPAFQVCRISGPGKMGLGLSQISENIIHELRAIYSSGRASPFDVDQLVTNRDLSFYYAELAHNIGFSELFLVVMKKDHGELQALLTKEDNVSNISQMDFYDRNILHVSSNWPDGLRLLLQRQDVRPLIDMTASPYIQLRPLDYALFYSKTYCNAPNQWTECDECTCYFSVQLLLEADCQVTVGPETPELLSNCSLKARKLFFEHLKDRRERLRNVAIAVLPEETLRHYGVTANFLPDKTAPILWSRLQNAEEQRDHLSVGLSESLKPYRFDFGSNPESLFGFPHPIEVVQLAVKYGLTPIDEIGVPTLLSGRYLLDAPENVTIDYLDWLLQYELKLELCLGPFRLSALHRIAGFIGSQLSSSLSQASALDRPLQDVYMSELKHARTLLAAICCTQTLCSIPCPCSSGMFTQPLAYVLPVMLRNQVHSDWTYFFETIGDNIELVVCSIDQLGLSKGGPEELYMAKCAIHIVTMMSLGVRHLPICLSEAYGDLEILKLEATCEQDWKEILDEDQELIKELQALDEEFGEAFDRQNVPIAEFLRGCWQKRMGEIVGELNKPLTDVKIFYLREVGVILKEDDTDGSGYCVEDTEDED
ncbi:hypothetical protein FPCIR_13701 [Fusarium pseudocircinatum]|uniref:Fungal N-terminal domain-containing protein n=1 Tax=Fusarium pseudocircinatum TaxID=56676 RepID=A0A8H5KJ72_9HYPO|nr:hypothetical protein FPCIR_13701 [Fusarium pseudocircinatum]